MHWPDLSQGQCIILSNIQNADSNRHKSSNPLLSAKDVFVNVGSRLIVVQLAKPDSFTRFIFKDE